MSRYVINYSVNGRQRGYITIVESKQEAKHVCEHFNKQGRKQNKHYWYEPTK